MRGGRSFDVHTDLSRLRSGGSAADERTRLPSERAIRKAVIAEGKISPYDGLMKWLFRLAALLFILEAHALGFGPAEAGADVAVGGYLPTAFRDEPNTHIARRSAPAALAPGSTFFDCKDNCPAMVVVGAGHFLMGSPQYAREQPQHTVTFPTQFAVGKFAVTFDEWAACAADGGCSGNPNPLDEGWGRGSRPVINVSWLDAKDYVSWLSKKTSQKYRLLTEAEWEYVGRSGATTNYP